MLTPSSLFKVALIVHYLAGKENPKIALYRISIKSIAKTLCGKCLFDRFYSFSILNVLPIVFFTFCLHIVLIYIISTKWNIQFLQWLPWSCNPQSQLDWQLYCCWGSRFVGHRTQNNTLILIPSQLI